MRIDLSCPVELWRYELPGDKYPACTLILYNLSDRLMNSVEITLLLKDQADEEIERIVYRAHDLDGRPSTAFQMIVPVNDKTRAHSAEVIFEKVWFDDNSIWRRSRGSMIEYTSNALPNSRSLEMLRFVAGTNAVGYPQEQEGLWLCVCGRPNADYAVECVRCHRRRDQVFTRYNRESIEKLVSQRERQLAMQSKSAREDASRMQLQREEEYNKRKKRRRRIQAIVAAIVVVLGAAYGTVFHLLPHLNYQNAVTAMDNKDWGTAITAFAAMGEYRDAPTLLNSCNYQSAAELMAKGDDASLIAARDLFISLGDYEDADTQAMEAEYRRANLFLADGDTASAAELYELLDGYADSDDKLTECAYLDACTLADNGSWAEAETAFRTLGDYADSAAMADECVYQQALAAVEAQKPDDALALLEKIPDHTDAAALTQQAHYVKGTLLREDGDNEAAGNAFLLAGDYLDAAELVIACIYEPAEALLAEGNYSAAREMYARIIGHHDATEKYMFCSYTLADGALRDGEYALATSMLAVLPNDYKDTALLKQEVIYLPAKDALAAEDWQKAVDGFSRIPGYRDADTQLKKAQYGLAETLVKADRLDEAIALYEQLGSYKESVKRLRSARYTRAGQLMTAGEYARAAVLYEKLGNYSDSKTNYRKAIFAQADNAYDEGNYAGARALYMLLDGYASSETRVMACDYQIALKKAESGDKLAAAELFASVSGYEDAEYQSQVLYYDLAEEAVANGQPILAGRYYALAGDYGDARAQAEENFDAYYLELSVTAQDAMDEGDYRLAITLLGAIDLNNLPGKYADLATMYQEAYYLEGVRLFDAGQPYEARAYFEKFPEYRASKTYLNRNCYRIIGDWMTDDGIRFTFREDGTCLANGLEIYFAVSGTYSVLTGETPESLTQTHKISDITATTLNLRDEREESAALYRLHRMTEEELALISAPTEAPATEVPPTDTPATTTEEPTPAVETPGPEQLTATPAATDTVITTETPATTDAPVTTETPATETDTEATATPAAPTATPNPDSFLVVDE